MNDPWNWYNIINTFLILIIGSSAIIHSKKQSDKILRLHDTVISLRNKLSFYEDGDK